MNKDMKVADKWIAVINKKTGHLNALFAIKTDEESAKRTAEFFVNSLFSSKPDRDNVEYRTFCMSEYLMSIFRDLDKQKGDA